MFKIRGIPLQITADPENSSQSFFQCLPQDSRRSSKLTAEHHQGNLCISCRLARLCWTGYLAVEIGRFFEKNSTLLPVSVEFWEFSESDCSRQCSIHRSRVNFMLSGIHCLERFTCLPLIGFPMHSESVAILAQESPCERRVMWCLTLVVATQALQLTTGEEQDLR